MTLTRERKKNPIVLLEVLETVRKFENQGREPTFNAILSELSTNRVLLFHRSLRKYLDLLVFARLLTMKYEKATQPNIREKQVYHSLNDNANMEAGEKSLLLHGLNWDIPSPMSLNIKTDLQALALATVSGNKVYASLEDTIVQSLKFLPRRHPERGSELIVFATALLATQKVDFNYLLRRAKEEGIEKEIIGILLVIDNTFASENPDVEDILTLYKLRDRYAHLRKSLLKSIEGTRQKVIDKEYPEKGILSPNQVVEYAGKQLGLRG